MQDFTLDYSLLAPVIESYRSMEDDLIKQVLRQLLKREPTVEDFKKLTRAGYDGRPGVTKLFYEGFPLGTIEDQFDYGCIGKSKLVFTPDFAMM